MLPVTAASLNGSISDGREHNSLGNVAIISVSSKTEYKNLAAPNISAESPLSLLSSQNVNVKLHNFRS
jgi:hypothetical protein